MLEKENKNSCENCTNKKENKPCNYILSAYKFTC